MAVLSKAKLQSLAYLRLKEAQALFDAGLYDGSLYLCGYVLELALKACICKSLDLAEYPENDLRGAFKTHSTKDLLLLSGLSSRLEHRRRVNPQFEGYWQTVLESTIEQRYDLGQSKADAEQMLNAVTEASDGVFPWLIAQW